MDVETPGLEPHPFMESNTAARVIIATSWNASSLLFQTRRRHANVTPSSGAYNGDVLAEAVWDAALTVRVVWAAAPPEGVNVDGAKAQDKAFPPPEQAKLTCWLKLFAGVTVRVRLAVWPDVMETFVTLEESWKSGGLVPPPPPLMAMKVFPAMDAPV